MVLEELVVGSPFVTGMALLLGLVIGLAWIRVPAELAILIIFPVGFTVVGFYYGGFVPILAAVSGFFIGFMMLKIMRH